MRDKYKNIGLSLFHFTWKSLLILSITTVLLEISYRYYLIDFYSSELKALNPESDLNLEREKTVLIFGDSFSATSDSWVNVIRARNKSWNIINCAISGTTVYHQQLFFNKRIRQYRPDKIIIQLYVGNDLIDYDRPSNWSQLALSRNFYWSVGDYFRCLQLLNYKLGALSKHSGLHDPKNNADFAVDKYSKRTKMYILAEESIISESISPSDYFKGTMNDLLTDLKSMVDQTDVPIYLIVIPHAVQTNEQQFTNFTKLKAELDADKIQKFDFLTETYDRVGDAVTIIDPLNVLSKKNVYYANDPHLTSEGQTILGNYVNDEADF